jgi:outer membrane protein assembly factor BamB
MIAAANSQRPTCCPSTVSGIDQDWGFAPAFGIASSPAVVNGDVYVGSSDETVYALDAGTGAQLWSFATGASLGVSRRQGDTGLRYEEVPCLLGKIELLKER